MEAKFKEYREICSQFVASVTSYMPEYSSRLKVHILLHLVDDMVEFGPASCFNTERYRNVLLCACREGRKKQNGGMALFLHIIPSCACAGDLQ